MLFRSFLSIFYPAAVYRKVSLAIRVKEEKFFSNFKVLEEEGYLKAAAFSFKKDNMAAKQENRKGTEGGQEQNNAGKSGGAVPESGDTGAKTENADTAVNGGKAEEDRGRAGEGEETEAGCDEVLLKLLMKLKKGDRVAAESYEIKEGETSPPKRYTSGSIILTMENAGQFIEDEELRAQIKGSGIGTSATRAEILKKLVNIEYLALNKKTQVLTPTLMGEMIYDVVNNSIRALLDPSLTASWEKGLTMVADGTITSEEYMAKLAGFVGRRTEYVKKLNNQRELYDRFNAAAANYKK